MAEVEDAGGVGWGMDVAVPGAALSVQVATWEVMSSLLVEVRGPKAGHHFKGHRP